MEDDRDSGSYFDREPGYRNSRKAGLGSHTLILGRMRYRLARPAFTTIRLPISVI